MRDAHSSLLLWHCFTISTVIFYNLFFPPTEPPVEFSKPLVDQTVEEEATAVLECELSRDKADVTWFRDGKEIRKTKKYDMVAEGRIRKLIIKDCTLDDSKTYTCDAKHFKTSAFLSVERKWEDIGTNLIIRFVSLYRGFSY